MREVKWYIRSVLSRYRHCRSKILDCVPSNFQSLNPLTPNDNYSGRTAPLTSKCCILYIYSTNIVTEYFKHGIHSPFFSLQNAVCFIIITYLVSVLFTFYIQGVLKFKKINILNMVYTLRFSSSKCSLFHNSNVFGSCIIHILYTGFAKIKKK
jgi:hypothetical protein